MTESSAVDGIEKLILDRKGDRTYERLSRDCGGVPSDKRLHQMVSRPIRTFPDPPTIKGLALGLNVSISTVLLSAARSLGLRVGEDGDSDALVLAGAGNLPAPSQEVLISMSRELQRYQAEVEVLQAGDGEDQPGMYGLAAHRGNPNIAPDQLPE